MDETFLNMLRCPNTGSRLQPADDELLRLASEAQVDGKLADRQGLDVEAFETGLVDEQRRWFYPVRNDIPSLIPDQAIDISRLNDQSTTAEKKSTDS